MTESGWNVSKNKIKPPERNKEFWIFKIKGCKYLRVVTNRTYIRVYELQKGCNELLICEIFLLDLRFCLRFHVNFWVNRRWKSVSDTTHERYKKAELKMLNIIKNYT